MNFTLDEIMKETFCSCGRVWSRLDMRDLGMVNLCFHGTFEVPIKITSSTGGSQ